MNSPSGTDSLHPGSVTNVASIQELFRFCLYLREHFVYGGQVLEAVALGANKFDLGNGNLNCSHSTHPFCSVCHFCVPGHLEC